MAPTGILAAQHYDEFCRLFQGLDVRIALLTGRTTTKERKQLLADLADGRIDILIGTHASSRTTWPFATWDWSSRTNSTASASASGQPWNRREKSRTPCS